MMIYLRAADLSGPVGHVVEYFPVRNKRFRFAHTIECDLQDIQRPAL